MYMCAHTHMCPPTTHTQRKLKTKAKLVENSAKFIIWNFYVTLMCLPVLCTGLGSLKTVMLAPPWLTTHIPSFSPISDSNDFKFITTIL